MPAKSKAQRTPEGAAVAAKRGEESKDELIGASKEMAKSMSEREQEELAATPRQGLPKRKMN